MVLIGFLTRQMLKLIASNLTRRNLSGILIAVGFLLLMLKTILHHSVSLFSLMMKYFCSRMANYCNIFSVQ